MTEFSEIDVKDRAIKKLNSAKIKNVEELIRRFPGEYYDFRHFLPLSEAYRHINKRFVSMQKNGFEPVLEKTKAPCLVRGMVISLRQSSSGNVVTAVLDDGSGTQIEVVWFQKRYMMDKIETQREYCFGGNIQFSTYKKGVVQMQNPIFYSMGDDMSKRLGIFPVEKAVRGIAADSYISILKKALTVHQKETLSEKTIKDLGLMEINEAYRQMHFPETQSALNAARWRFVFEDLFNFVFQLRMAKEKRNGLLSSFPIKSFEKTTKLKSSLPFELTVDQASTLRNISQKLTKGQRVEALIQGDVGCGKTMVALMLLCIFAENGYQGALIAPTNILANQHYEELSEYLEPLDIHVVKLTGDMKASEKKKVCKELAEGSADVCIGTHAIIQDNVVFKSLAISVVDEQHRFGVEQRKKLQEKSSETPNFVSMSATPIPRSLSMAMYGEAFDVHTIKSMPNGRKPVKTVHTFSFDKTFEKMIVELKKGRQCYVVCPLIDKETESKYSGNLYSAEETFIQLSQMLEEHGFSAALVTGKTKKADLNEIMDKFTANQIQALVATTVIEVGVNVPNSTIIVIRNAERFGLAQLHQLRGRVGRGKHQSYCLLESEFQNVKVDVMVSTTDGFEIAEKDLELRGAGEYFGLRQSGVNRDMELVMQFPNAHQKVVQYVEKIYNGKEGKKYADQFKHVS